MNTINLSANGNKLSITNPSFLTSGGAKFEECSFTLDDSWYGFAKRAVFSVGDEAEYAVDLVNNACLVPKKCLEKEGILKIGLVGKKIDGTIISTNFVAQKIQRGANQNKIVSFMGVFESPQEDTGEEPPAEDEELIIIDNDEEDIT